MYDRSAGRLLGQEIFERRSEALEARFATEKSYRDERRDVEVVVVGAASEEDLRRTHGRYFLSVEELAERTATLAHEG